MNGRRVSAILLGLILGYTTAHSLADPHVVGASAERIDR
jgi:hypothetical protein